MEGKAGYFEASKGSRLKGYSSHTFAFGCLLAHHVARLNGILVTINAGYVVLFPFSHIIGIIFDTMGYPPPPARRRNPPHSFPFYFFSSLFFLFFIPPVHCVNILQHN